MGQKQEIEKIIETHEQLTDLIEHTTKAYVEAQPMLIKMLIARRIRTRNQVIVFLGILAIATIAVISLGVSLW